MNAGTLGGNICNASPAGDTLPPLYAMDARVIVTSTEGDRTLPIEQFVTGPGTTALRCNELLREIIVPRRGWDIVCYRKVGTRRANALSKLSFAGLARVSGHGIEDVRMAFGAVAPTVLRCRAAEELVKNHATTLTPNLRERAASLCAEQIKPIDDQRSNARYRKRTCLRLLDRFIVCYLMPALTPDDLTE